ncbi:MAG: TonB-dependent receptor [Gammaproteobacteria bacterium]|nr:TonB-dependent receptor [Gammaproteobacteria bacterium]MDE0283981.1 TonB-dependent receptor [Gammaproteobacteria bacterium]MDE0512879.1 TonB-dependent receptor [Gammaproteobacteria bacterium]
MNKLIIKFSGFILALLVPCLLFAQTIEEVIVTAQKREQSLQDVSVAITAFSGDEINVFGMVDAWDIAMHTPNMAMTGFYDYSRVEIVMRGISLNNLFGSIDQPPVAVYQDEVYVGARAALSQMFDLERVEVLRGPQGTLYGRNTTGGAVNFIANKPSEEPNLTGSFTYGRYDQVGGEIAGNMPLSDTLAIRAAGVYRTSDGWAHNQFDGSTANGHDNYAGRIMLSWKPNSNIDALLTVHGSSAESDTPAIHALGYGNFEPNDLLPFAGVFYQEDPDFHTFSNDQPGFEDNETFGLAANIKWNVGNVTMTTIFSYDEHDTVLHEDTDGTPYDMFTIDYADEFESWSFEQRAAGNAEGGPLQGLDWVIGFNYYEDETVTANDTRFFFDPVLAPLDFLPLSFEGFSNYTQDGSVWALFADFRYPLAEKFAFNGGVRYTDEEKDFDWELSDNYGSLFLVDETESWDAFTGRAGLEWTPTEDLLFYANYSRGFKSGGFNGVVLSPPPPGFSLPNVSFDPEFIDAYEIGMKSSWLDNRLIINASMFRNDLKDQQFLVVLPGIIFQIDNAAASTVDGIELEMQFRPVEGLYIQFGLGLLDAEFDEFIDADGASHAGNPLPATSDVNLNGVVQYTLPLGGMGTLTPRFEFTHYSEQNYDRFGKNRIDSLLGYHITPKVDIQEAYEVFNASLTWRSVDEKYSLMAWIRNLSDEEYVYKTIGNNADALKGIGGATSFHAPPRTYGVTFRFDY